jgi:membrane associated rhomboid family serine protease
MSYTGNRFGNPFGFTVTLWVKRLLIANGVVFVLTLAFHALVPFLAFTPALALYQPWSIVTYMFVHAGFFHLFFNMLVLFFFGPPLEDRWGSTEFLKFYVICGIGGALLSLVFWNVSIVGASAAVYGVMLAFAMYWPDNPIYIWGIFPVKAKWLVGGLIGLSLFFALTGGAPGTAHLAHLGGAAAAFIYLKSSYSPGPFGSRPKKPKRARPASETTVTSLRARSAARPATHRTAANQEEEQLLDEIDRILDKISARGMDSLTTEERGRLDEASRRFKTD